MYIAQTVRKLLILLSSHLHKHCKQMKYCYVMPVLVLVISFSLGRPTYRSLDLYFTTN